MQTGLSFCNETNSRLAGVCIWNEAALNCGPAHFGLLRAFPSVGMTEDHLKLLFHGAPQGLATGMCVDDEVLRAPEEVAKVIPKDLYGRFALWEGGKAHPVHLEFHGLRPEPKLESILAVLNTITTR
jgi:hypothetical protein